VPEQVGRAGQPGCQVAQVVPGVAVGLGGGVGQPEGARGTAEPVVPLRERIGELAGAPSARPQVPRLGDQLHPGEHRVRLQGDQEGVAPAVLGRVTTERDGEVEAEAVHAHALHPVPQAVQRHLDHPAAAEVERVPAAREVGVGGGAAPVVQVVARVVEAAPAQVGAVATRLRGVVVDDVEDHFDAGLVEEAHHALDLVQDRCRPTLLRAAGGVGRFRGEEGEGVVAPVVGQAALEEERLARDRLDREQFERGDAERAQVVDQHRVREAGVGAAQVLRDPGEQLGEAAHVGLVDHGLAPGHVRAGCPAPRVLLQHHAVGHVRGRVRVVAHQLARIGVEIGVDPVPVDLGAQDEGSVDSARVGVEQQLVDVVPQARRGVPATVDTESVVLPGAHAGDVSVPHAVDRSGERVPPLHPAALAVGVQEAEVHRIGLGGHDGGVDAVPGQVHAEAHGHPQGMGREVRKGLGRRAHDCRRSVRSEHRARTHRRSVPHVDPCSVRDTGDGRLVSGMCRTGPRPADTDRRRRPEWQGASTA